MQRDQSQDADLQQTEQLDAHKEGELNTESPQRGEATEVGAGQRAHFFAVANALLTATDGTAPELALPENATRREQEAIKLIYEAKTGKESEQSGGSAGGRVAGVERMRYLQMGLAAVQQTLALARNPEFQRARSHIDELRKRLAQLKDEINQQIIDEEQKKRDEKSKKPDEAKPNEPDKKKNIEHNMTRK
jgi:polyhydroxyalkanoate synthesis regulator phasin